MGKVRVNWVCECVVKIRRFNYNVVIFFLGRIKMMVYRFRGFWRILFGNYYGGYNMVWSSYMLLVL